MFLWSLEENANSLFSWLHRVASCSGRAACPAQLRPNLLPGLSVSLTSQLVPASLSALVLLWARNGHPAGRGLLTVITWDSVQGHLLREAFPAWPVALCPTLFLPDLCHIIVFLFIVFHDGNYCHLELCFAYWLLFLIFCHLPPKVPGPFTCFAPCCTHKNPHQCQTHCRGSINVVEIMHEFVFLTPSFLLWFFGCFMWAGAPTRFWREEKWPSPLDWGQPPSAGTPATPALLVGPPASSSPAPGVLGNAAPPTPRAWG